MNSALPLLIYTKTLKIVDMSHFLKISHNASDRFLPKHCHFPTVTEIEFLLCVLRSLVFLALHFLIGWVDVNVVMLL